MATPQRSSRRDFLKTVAATSALAVGTPGVIRASGSSKRPRPEPRRYSPNENIRVAALGMGIIAFYNMDAIAQVDGVEFVAACDCYDGRLTRTQEVYGETVHVTRDYREILARDDIDAVIINAPDHWHTRMAVDAMHAGKAVHIEKPMIQKIEEGPQIIAAQQATGMIAQVGSEGFRDPVHQKTKALIQEGAIGQLNMVESEVSRNNGIGAWQYSIPPDASPKTIDWSRFLGHAPKRAFDADRFFCWRKYWDYGTGVAGDMFVHRFSALHFMLDSLGPTRVMATGGVRYWNDGREAPDIITGLYDYPATASHPAFTLIMKANFADGSGGGPTYRFIGNEGVLEIRGATVTLTRNPARETPVEYLVRGYNSVRTFAQAQQDAFVAEYNQYRPSAAAPEPNAGQPQEHTVERKNMLVEHFTNFFEAIRNDGPIVQDPTYGFRAAAPAILANYSYLSGNPVTWNPTTMQMDPA